MVNIQEVSDKITDFIMDKHGRLFPHCEEGARRVVTATRAMGFKARKCHGFYGFTQHWWAEVDGIIVDPTAGQFGRMNGVQLDTASYDEVSDADIHLLGHRSSVQFDRWSMVKRYRAAGVALDEQRGERKTETRIDKKGREYTYHGYVVHFSLDYNEGVRSIVELPNKNGTTTFLVCVQKRMLLRTGRVLYPTKTLRFVAFKGGYLMQSYEGELVNPFADFETVSMVGALLPVRFARRDARHAGEARWPFDSLMEDAF